MNDLHQRIADELKSFKPQLDYKEHYLAWLEAAHRKNWRFQGFFPDEKNLATVEDLQVSLEEMFETNLKFWRNFVTHISQLAGYPSLWGRFHPAASPSLDNGKTEISELSVSVKEKVKSKKKVASTPGTSGKQGLPDGELKQISEEVKSSVGNTAIPNTKPPGRVTFGEGEKSIKFGRGKIPLPMPPANLEKWSGIYIQVFDELSRKMDEKRILEKKWVQTKTEIGKCKSLLAEIANRVNEASTALKIFESKRLFSKCVSLVSPNFDEAVIWLPPHLGFAVDDFLDLATRSELLFTKAPAEKTIAGLAQLSVLADEHDETFWSEISSLALVTAFWDSLSGTNGCILCGLENLPANDASCECSKSKILDEAISQHFETDLASFKQQFFISLTHSFGKRISNANQVLALAVGMNVDSSKLHKSTVECLNLECKLFPRKMDNQASIVLKEWKTTHNREFDLLTANLRTITEKHGAESTNLATYVEAIAAIDATTGQVEAEIDLLRSDKFVLERARMLSSSSQSSDPSALKDSLDVLSGEFAGSSQSVSEREFWSDSIHNLELFGWMCNALISLALTANDLDALTCTQCAKSLGRCRCQSIQLRVDTFLKKFSGMSLPKFAHLLESNKKRIWGIFHLEETTIKAQLNNIFDADREAFQGLVCRALFAEFNSRKGSATFAINDSQVKSLVGKWPGLAFLGHESLNSAMSSDFLILLVNKVQYYCMPISSARALWNEIEKSTMDAGHKNRLGSIPSTRTLDSYDD